MRGSGGWCYTSASEEVVAVGIPVPTGRKVCFGEFELDLETRELNGPRGKVDLQEQPFQILAALLEKPNQMVTRNQLTRRLWPTGTFVDFERSLNKAVNRLREALGDSAENPRFIQTVPRRGYRFVAPMRSLAAPAKETVPAKIHSWPLPDPVPHSMVQTVWHRKAVWFAAFVAIILVCSATILFRQARWASVTAPANYKQLTHDGMFKDSLLTDGARLYYRAENAAGVNLMEVAAAGGSEPLILQIPFEQLGLHDISPDGSRLLLTRVENELQSQNGYQLILPAGSPVRLGETAFHSATWSPDGQFLAIARDAFVFIGDREGGRIRKIATLPGETDFPRWSPDGTLLRFTVYDNAASESEIWQVRPDGSDLTQVKLTNLSPRRECCGQWTSDGRYFLFLVEQESRETLWALPEKSGWWKANSSPIQLTFGPARVVSFTTSRRTNRVFLVSGLDRSEIVRYDVPSKTFHPYLGGPNIFALEFSPDRQQVVYTNPDDGTLWRALADGRNSTRLTEPGLYVLKPRWSPDGKNIAFAGYRGAKLGQVYVIPSGGGTPQQLTNGDASVGFVSWSADGATLLVGEWNSASTEEKNFRMIHCYFLDLRTMRRTPLKGSEGLYGPQWSPDGRYVSAKTQTDDLRLFDLQTGAWSDLANGPASWATWSHDGRFIYFASADHAIPVLKRVRAVDHEVQTVLNLQQLRRRKDAGNANWIGLGPDDVPIAVRDVSTFDIYSLDLKLP